MSIRTGVLVDTLKTLGGTVPVSAWKGDTMPELCWCIEEMITVPGAGGCDQLVDFVATQRRRCARTLSRAPRPQRTRPCQILRAPRTPSSRVCVAGSQGFDCCGGVAKRGRMGKLCTKRRPPACCTFRDLRRRANCFLLDQRE